MTCTTILNHVTYLQMAGEKEVVHFSCKWQEKKTMEVTDSFASYFHNCMINKRRLHDTGRRHVHFSTNNDLINSSAHVKKVLCSLHTYCTCSLHLHTHDIQCTDVSDKLATHTHSLIHCLCLSALDRAIHPVHVWRLSEGISSIVQIHSQILGLAHLSSR